MHRVRIDRSVEREVCRRHYRMALEECGRNFQLPRVNGRDVVAALVRFILWGVDELGSRDEVWLDILAAIGMMDMRDLDNRLYVGFRLFSRMIGSKNPAVRMAGLSGWMMMSDEYDKIMDGVWE